MAEFLLSCTCGRKTSVSIAQAGQSIRCPCGAQLEAPTLRGLAALERAAESGDSSTDRPASPAWDNRHRTVFSLVVISLVSLSISAYLAATLPQVVKPPTPEEIEAGFAANSPLQVLTVYQELLEKGLEPPTVVINADVDVRLRMLWEIAITLALGGFGLAGAAGVLLTRPRTKRKIARR